MNSITRSLALMTLAIAVAPRFAAAQGGAIPDMPAGPNASEPGAIIPAPATPSPAASPATAPYPVLDPDSGEKKKARYHLKLGVDYTLYLPTDKHTRDRFGSSWSSLGLGVGGVGQSDKRSKWSPEFNLIIQTKGDNHVVMAPLGFTYRTHWGTVAATQPYTGASLGALIVDLHSKEDNVSSGISAGAYGSIYAGLSFKDNYFVEARYYAASKVRSFDLSGASLSAGIRF